MLRCFAIRPERGNHKSAQGNALGLVERHVDSALKGKNKSAQGNALGLVSLRAYFTHQCPAQLPIIPVMRSVRSTSIATVLRVVANNRRTRAGYVQVSKKAA
jgi:hypothetical protein